MNWTDNNVMTPWGFSDHVKEDAPGIVFYSTPGHGGFLLDDARHAAVKKMLPNFKTFAGGKWYEEDCDACAVVACFPEAYTPEKVKHARARLAADPEYYGRLQLPPDSHKGWDRLEAALDDEEQDEQQIQEPEPGDYDRGQDEELALESALYPWLDEPSPDNDWDGLG